MFDKEYSFKGKHAEMVSMLTSEFTVSTTSNISSTPKKHKLFDRNLDVYILAPIIGFMYGRKAEVDTKSDIKPTKIFQGQLSSGYDDLVFNYRLIMLLDKSNEPDSEKRIEKAFRGNQNLDDEALYNRYVLGGVEVLYEKLMKDAKTADEYVNRLYDFLEEFSERYNDDLDMEKVLESCRKASY